MSPPPRTPTAPRPAPPRTAPDAPAVDLDAPRPNPGETATLAGTVVGKTVTLYSSKDGHRIEVKVTGDMGPARQVIEYPADAWASAARFLVAYVEGLLVSAGSTTRGSVYCGDCSNPVHKGACARHGEIG